MGVTAPDYSENGQLDRDKIRSTIVHEALHSSSHGHVGFQQETDTSVSNSNYDEHMYRLLCPSGSLMPCIPGRVYKTGYFTTSVGGEAQHWGGNMAKFMIDSGHDDKERITEVVILEQVKLNPLPGQLLDKWKAFSKQNEKSIENVIWYDIGKKKPPPNPLRIGKRSGSDGGFLCYRSITARWFSPTRRVRSGWSDRRYLQTARYRLRPGSCPIALR